MVRCQSGFSLLEVLVAFSITAVTLGILYQIYAKGSIAAILAGEYAGALSIAESKLAGATVNGALSDFHFRGRSQDKYDWDIRIENHDDDNQDSSLPSSLSLVHVDVAVSWHSRGGLHRIDLQTLKPVIHPDGSNK